MEEGGLRTEKSAVKRTGVPSSSLYRKTPKKEIEVETVENYQCGKYIFME